MGLVVIMLFSGAGECLRAAEKLRMGRSVNRAVGTGMMEIADNLYAIPGAKQFMQADAD